MSVIKAGWSRLWRHRGLIVVWWLAGLLTAAVSLWPLRAVLASVFGSSLAEVELRSRLDVSHVVDLMSATPGAMPAITAAALGGLVLWLVVSSALSAGTLGVLCERRSHDGFGAALTRWWGVFLRLELAALVLLPVVVVAPALVQIGVRVAGGETPPEPMAWWGGRAALVLAVVGLVLTRLVVRFGRIAAVRHDQRRVWKLLRSGLAGLRRWWWQGLLLTLTTGLVAAAVLALESRLAGVLHGSATAIAALVALQQLLVLVRTTARLWRTATEVELVEQGEIARGDGEEGILLHPAAAPADGPPVAATEAFELDPVPAAGATAERSLPESLDVASARDPEPQFPPPGDTPDGLPEPEQTASATVEDPVPPRDP